MACLSVLVALLKLMHFGLQKKGHVVVTGKEEHHFQLEFFHSDQQRAGKADRMPCRTYGHNYRNRASAECDEHERHTMVHKIDLELPRTEHNQNKCVTPLCLQKDTGKHAMFPQADTSETPVWQRSQ